MVKKTLFVFILLFAGYTFTLMLMPGSSVSQHQWQENVVKGEKYIYNQSDTISNVITGSSLACRIITDELPGFYNLAFAGQSVFDGLEIINKTEKAPKNVFIEINKVFITPSADFTASLFSPLSFNSKKYCISLRSDKQPLAFIFPAIQNIFKNKKQVKKSESDPSTSNSVQKGIFNKMLTMQINEYSQIPDTNLVNKQFLLLATYAKELKNKGINIVFFEMPLNPGLIELPLAKFIRANFYKYFPESQYNYINIPDCSDYVTTDGLHLTDLESGRYTAYFKDGIKKYTP